MSDHTHENHTHVHGPGCGHTAIAHGDHTDYLHDGHLHRMRSDGVVEEHEIHVSPHNPDECTPEHDCGGHEPGHVHGSGCGHEPVPHGDHCDDHGPVNVVQND
jgi:hypothetical protein